VNAFTVPIVSTAVMADLVPGQILFDGVGIVYIFSFCNQLFRYMVPVWIPTLPLAPNNLHCGSTLLPAARA